jgi:hypothetical protein
MEQIIQFSPAFDKRNPDPSKNYGVGALMCKFVLKGEIGAVQFVFGTGIYLPHVVEEWKCKNYQAEPMAYDVDYHSPKPLYEDQCDMGECEYLDGKTCYYDGSSLMANEYLQVLVSEGDKAVWSKMEGFYLDRFGELK